jgi:hypothetical protein
LKALRSYSEKGSPSTKPLAIKRQRGLEGRSAAGLEAQPAKATRAGLAYDVFQQSCGHPPPEVVRVGAH